MPEHISQKLVASLAEHNWDKRRRLVFGFTIFFCVFFCIAAALIVRLAQIYPAATPIAITALASMCTALSVLGGLIATYYLVAPTGENIAAIAGAVASARTGVSLNVGGGVNPEFQMVSGETASDAGNTNLKES